jgi:peptide/nickel transport system substrate-binding protein
MRILNSILLFCCFLSGCETNGGRKWLIQYFDSLPEVLDPVESSGLYDAQIYANIYESLVILDEDGVTIRPGLASKWHVDNDLTRYVFELKSGICFHDGSPVNAEAVLSSFRRQFEKNESAPLFNMIENIEMVDSLTLAFQLKFPYAQFLYTLSSPIGFKAISQKALDNFGDNIGRHPVGSGPFKMTEWQDNKKIILTRNDKYSEFSGNLEGLVFKDLEDYSDLEELIDNGKCDVYYSIPSFYIDRLKWLGKIEYATIKSFSLVFIGFNNEDPILKQKFVRQAILSGIDRLKLVKYILRGNSILAEGPLPPVFSLPMEYSQSDYNLERSEDLMNLVGLEDGITLKFFYIERYRTRYTILEAIKNEMQKINIRLEMIPFDSYEDLNQACRSDSAQIFLNSWQADVLGDPENFLYSLFYSASDFNFLHYNNTLVNNWLDQARLESNWDTRQILYQKIIKQIMADTPGVFLYHVIPVYAYNKDKIRSLPINPYSIVNYHQVNLYE